MCSQRDPQPRRTGEPFGANLKDSPRDCVSDSPNRTSQAQAQWWGLPVTTFVECLAILASYLCFLYLPDYTLCDPEPVLLWSCAWFQVNPDVHWKVSPGIQLYLLPS